MSDRIVSRPFDQSVTYERWEIAMGLRCGKCLKLVGKKGCGCPKK